MIAYATRIVVEPERADFPSEVLVGTGATGNDKCYEE